MYLNRAELEPVYYYSTQLCSFAPLTVLGIKKKKDSIGSVSKSKIGFGDLRANHLISNKLTYEYFHYPLQYKIY